MSSALHQPFLQFDVALNNDVFSIVSQSLQITDKILNYYFTYI